MSESADRVLVTGAGGYIGRHVCKALNGSRFRIHALTRSGRGAPHGAAGHVADLFDCDAVARVLGHVRPTHLVHCAWVTEHGQYWTAPGNEKWVAATLHLARTFFANGGQRFVFTGTCAVYDWSAPGLGERGLREDEAAETPETPYGRAKKAAAEGVLCAAKDAGATAADARLFFPAGNGEDPRRLLPDIIGSLMRGEPARIGPGNVARDVMDVRDAGAALAAILESKASGAVNVGTGRPVRLGDLATEIGRLMGRPDLIRVGALPPRPGDPVCFYADVTRLRGETGFAPAYDTATMLRDAIDWWTANADPA